VFVFFAREAAGESFTRLSLRPVFREAKDSRTARARSAPRDRDLAFEHGCLKNRIGSLRWTLMESTLAVMPRFKRGIQ
jgi:hypothetical protein